MKVTLKNVASIKEGNIQIDDGKINILYGSNGIGKTTFIKALREKIYNTFEQNIEHFIPLFNSNATPKITLADCNVSDILIFNRDYVDNYLYKEDLANDSYALIAKTPDFEGKIKTINEMLDKVKQTIFVPVINSLKTDFDSVDKGINFKETKKGDKKVIVNATSKIGKACKECVKKEVKLVGNLTKYSAFKSILNWIDWVKTGLEITNRTDKTTCPFCGHTLTKQDIEDINNVTSLGTTKTFQDNEMARNQLLNLNKYANAEIQNAILKFCETEKPISQIDAIDLKNAIDLIKSEINKITAVSLLAPISASNIDRKDLMNYFETKKVDLSVFNGASEELLKALTAYNNSLENLESEANSLLAELGKLNSSKKKLVDEFKSTINQFLKLAGIPYEAYVDMSDNNAFTHLRYIKTDKNITNVKNTLSYGEFNSVALCLFALEATKKDNTLIVLDDPISSYDSEKRAAILISLFYVKNTGLCLKEKTTIILTHDFETLVPFFKWPWLKNEKYVSGWHLFSKNSVLNQDSINALSIKNSAVLERKYAKNTSLPFIVRIVHLRRYYQLVNLDGDEFQYLSCLIHNDSDHEYPSFKQGNEYSQMNDDKIKTIENEFSKILGKGDFKIWKEQIRKVPDLIEKYKVETNNYNKLIIARQIINIQSKGKVNWTLVKTYITETYHVDTEHIFGFEDQFDNVPDYILSICDEIIQEISESIVKSNNFS